MNPKPHPKLRVSARWNVPYVRCEPFRAEFRVAKAERQKVADPEPWRVLVDAKAQIARTLRPEAWTRYDANAFELEGPPAETAARRLLLRARSLWEGVDWDAVRAAAGPSRRRTPVSPPMTRAERRRLELTRECQRLEAEFDAVLGTELQAERWEGESAAGPIATAPGFIAGLAFDVADNAVQPGSAPRLLGIRLRPTQPEATPGVVGGATVAGPQLVRAKIEEIRLVLDELHDMVVIEAGFKPPTPREAGQRGKRLLAERGQYATASRIEEIAREQPYAKVRLKRGEHFKRKIARQIAS
jgi:hypothetical protein